MFGNRRILIAILASVAVIAVVAGCGSSKDHSSEWSSSQQTRLKDEAQEKVPEFTDDGVACLVDGITSGFSPSENGKLDQAGEEKVEGIVNNCAETSSNVQGILSQACQEEGLISEGCEDEMINQATEDFGVEGYEESEPYEAEGEYENQGLEEMDQELQQEYEEGKWGPESE
ncbi:MAG: hypothetical protein ACRDPE_18085 [Solirubrobacterales bacterium]